MAGLLLVSGLERLVCWFLCKAPLLVYCSAGLTDEGTMLSSRRLKSAVPLSPCSSWQLRSELWCPTVRIPVPSHERLTTNRYRDRIRHQLHRRHRRRPIRRRLARPHLHPATPLDNPGRGHGGLHATEPAAPHEPRPRGRMSPDARPSAQYNYRRYPSAHRVPRNKGPARL